MIKCNKKGKITFEGNVPDIRSQEQRENSSWKKECQKAKLKTELNMR